MAIALGRCAPFWRRPVRLRNGIELVHGQVLERLLVAARPLDGESTNHCRLAQTKMNHRLIRRHITAGELELPDLISRSRYRVKPRTQYPSGCSPYL